jgi:hypothetical protein
VPARGQLPEKGVRGGMHFRHGLTAVTIVDMLEDPADFVKFERKIHADYSPHTAVE